jgi:putative membrane protein
MAEPRVLRQAEFDRKVKAYWIWQPTLIIAAFIITIPIAILYAIVASIFTEHYLKSLRCILTERTLEIKKGIFNRRESTVPLEKITDLQLFQGPIMRQFGLHGFKVETAGQSSPSGGALVNMIGIVDTPGFRKAVLDQRDQLVGAPAHSGTQPTGESARTEGATDLQHGELLTEIRDSLLRIEKAVRK